MKEAWGERLGDEGLPLRRAVDATPIVMGVTGVMDAHQGMYPRLHRWCDGRDKHQARGHSLFTRGDLWRA